MPVVLQENTIPKNSRGLRIKFVGVSNREFNLAVGADDFSDNREKSAMVVAKSRGAVYAVIEGENPDAITGSLTVDFWTENNGKADAFLDVIDGRQAWATESTGKVGSPYVQKHVVTMIVTYLGAAEDGGDMVRTYEKTYFVPSFKSATDKTSISVNWMAYGTVSGTGPT
jgi:hypothetical protein